MYLEKEEEDKILRFLGKMVGLSKKTGKMVEMSQP